MDEFVQLISTLLASRNQAHIFHWQVEGIGSYSAHKALNKYYDEVLDLVDGLVEGFQGRYGIQRGYTSPATFKEDGQALLYFEALSKYVETIRTKIPQDSFLQNEIDTVVKLIETTKYKLKNLK
jgi:DNA-binding ferritin-like protein